MPARLLLPCTVSQHSNLGALLSTPLQITDSIATNSPAEETSATYRTSSSGSLPTCDALIAANEDVPQADTKHGKVVHAVRSSFSVRWGRGRGGGDVGAAPARHRRLMAKLRSDAIRRGVFSVLTRDLSS